MGMVGGGWGPTFLFFKSLYNTTTYSLSIDIYLCQRNLCRTKVLWVLKFGEVGDRTNKNQNPPRYEAFWFFVQNFIFCGAGCSFWYLFIYIKKENEKREKRGFNVRKIKENIRKNEKREENVRTKKKEKRKKKIHIKKEN